MPKFRKKPVVVEAMHYTGEPENCRAIHAWAGWEHPASEEECRAASVIIIDTLEGQMEASVGDWIVRGVEGEFYPCKASVFEATYEPVQEKT